MVWWLGHDPVHRVLYCAPLPLMASGDPGAVKPDTCTCTGHVLASPCRFMVLTGAIRKAPSLATHPQAVAASVPLLPSSHTLPLCPSGVQRHLLLPPAAHRVRPPAQLALPKAHRCSCRQPPRCRVPRRHAHRPMTLWQNSSHCRPYPPCLASLACSCNPHQNPSLPLHQRPCPRQATAVLPRCSRSPCPHPPLYVRLRYVAAPALSGDSPPLDTFRPHNDELWEWEPWRLRHFMLSTVLMGGP